MQRVMQVYTRLKLEA